MSAPSQLSSSPSTLLVVAMAFAVGAILSLAAASRVRTIHLALGFATTATLWTLGYGAMIGPGLALGEALFALMLATLLVAGFVTGRYGGESASPVKVGLVSATANLLVLGAFLRDEQGGSRWLPVAYVCGLFAVSALLAWIGGLAGRAMRSSRTLPPSAELFAIVVAGTMFLLLLAGGLVTGLESGLAVPDWPNSFGHNMLLFPISQMRGGVLYEHAHRLFGMLVGVTSLAFVSVIWRDDRRSWVRALVIALLVMVCVQGLLGGLRVTGRLTAEQDRSLLAPSITLAIVHGVFAQVVFSTALLLAAATSRTWLAATPPIAVASAATDRGLSILLPGAILIQLVFGAAYRHLQPGVAAPTAPPPTWALHAHLTFAAVVLLLAILVGGRAASGGAHPILRRLGKATLLVVTLQVALGIAALIAVWSRSAPESIPAIEVVVTTAHQVTGAILLGLSVLIAAWTRRLLVVPVGEPAGTTAQVP